MPKCPWCGKPIEIKSSATVRKVADKAKPKPKGLGNAVKTRK